MPKIKICCISSKEEARMAIAAGADILGFVGPMPSGPGILDGEQIAAIVKHFSGRVSCCLLSSAKDPAEIIRQIEHTGVGMIQLVHLPQEDTYRRIRAAFPALKIIQVIHVDGPGSIDLAEDIDGKVDFILLDSGRPAENILGGTGLTHDWAISQKIIKNCRTPVFLAGGINADNVQQALKKVRPYGLDLCSGIRTNDKLDPSKLHRFFKQTQKTHVWED